MTESVVVDATVGGDKVDGNFADAFVREDASAQGAVAGSTGSEGAVVTGLASGQR